MRKTKIICTLGPSTANPAMIRKLYAAGMNVVRMNMSHGDHAFHQRVIEMVKELNEQVEFPVALLLDTQGPEIRTGTVAEDMALREGEVVTVTIRGGQGVEQSSILIEYEDLIEQVSIGDRITVDNGLINLEVLSKDGTSMQCRVVDGGMLGSRRHVNLPGIRVNLPAITRKDEKDIAFGIANGIDYIALSFVRCAGDVRELQQLLGADAHRVKIIAKIEDQEGVRNVEEIVDVADGLMVARGDLGVEVNIEDLPNIQRRLVRLCAERGKRVIVATHLLESMIQNPFPTRAEVTDVANAIYEEVDAVMLSGESAVGKYPVKCVEMLDRIARASEQGVTLGFARDLQRNETKQHLAAAAVELAQSLGAKGLVAVTQMGSMASFLTNCRPNKTPIFAFTNNPATQRMLALNRHVAAHFCEFSDDPEHTLRTAFTLLRSRAGLRAGDQVVVVSDVLQGKGIEGLQVRTLI